MAVGGGIALVVNLWWYGPYSTQQEASAAASALGIGPGVYLVHDKVKRRFFKGHRLAYIGVSRAGLPSRLLQPNKHWNDEDPDTRKIWIGSVGDPAQDKTSQAMQGIEEGTAWEIETLMIWALKPELAGTGHNTRPQAEISLTSIWHDTRQRKIGRPRGNWWYSKLVFANNKLVRRR